MINNAIKIFFNEKTKEVFLKNSKSERRPRTSDSESEEYDKTMKQFT